MTFRFFRSIKLFPGFRLNIGKRGLGWSFGARGLHVGRSTQGGKYFSATLPGSVYARQDFKEKK